MPNFSMQAFAAAQFAGSQLNAELDNRRQDAEIKKMQVQEQRQALSFREQQQQQQQLQMQQMSKLIQDFDQEGQVKQVTDGVAPDNQQQATADKESKQYAAMGKLFLMTDPAKAANFFKLADSAEGKAATAEKRNLEINEKRAKDTASFAGAVLTGDVPPAEAFQWVKDHVSLRDALAIPTDPVAAKAWWRAKQVAGTTAESQISGQRQEREFAEREKDRRAAAEQTRQAHLDTERDRALSRDILRSSQAAAAEERAARRAEAADGRHFRETEKLNTSAQAVAKPLLEDRARIENVENLLRINSPEADQQVRQALVGVLGNFKGKATNLFYKDNKNFGDVVDKVEGMVSRTFTGRYSDANRVEIQKLMTGLKRDGTDPSLARLEADQKKKAKGYGLDPEQVRLQGDFERTPRAAAQPQAYSEGAVARNPTTGQTLVFKNGKWTPQ